VCDLEIAKRGGLGPILTVAPQKKPFQITIKIVIAVETYFGERSKKCLKTDIAET
jgi:hypothetical protein